MTTDRRNPYVILGVPFGASKQEARSGFARARRLLRQDAEARYTDEDLTWALHQIEQLIAHPELAVDTYRLPANPDVMKSAPVGLFSPSPHRIERSSVRNEEMWEAIRRDALAAALRRLLKPVIVSTSPGQPYE